MGALYCGQHDAEDRHFCPEHRDWDHCKVIGDAERAAAERAGTEERSLHWTEALAILRRRYVPPA